MMRAPALRPALLGILLGVTAGTLAPFAPDLVPGAALALERPVAADTLSVEERSRALSDLSILAHDSMEGRRTGTPGIERARRFLLEAFEESGLQPIDERRLQEFEPSGGSGEPGSRGANILGVVPGRVFSGRFIVVSAHYDHLGMRGSQIYNGADDNASGTAALLALASHFSGNPTDHSLLFVAFDAEEMGLLGARAFVSNPAVPLDSVVLNVNLDMVSRSDAGELYAAGTYHYPFLGELVAEVAGRSGVTVLTGHDRPSLPPGDDWTSASDHGPFHDAGIPFLYFGVEDHPDYHRPTDTVDRIMPEFYLAAVETVLDFIRVADARGASILAPRARVGR